MPFEDQPVSPGSGQIACQLPQAPLPHGFVAVMVARGIDRDGGASGNDPIRTLTAALGFFLLEVQHALPG